MKKWIFGFIVVAAAGYLAYQKGKLDLAARGGPAGVPSDHRNGGKPEH